MACAKTKIEIVSSRIISKNKDAMVVWLTKGNLNRYADKSALKVYVGENKEYSYIGIFKLEKILNKRGRRMRVGWNNLKYFKCLLKWVDAQ